MPMSTTSIKTPSSREDILALTKPRITFMALIVAFGSMLLADAPLTCMAGVASLFGIALLVSGSSAFNMYLERDVDKHMTRTKDRPLPAGRMVPKMALIVGTVATIAAVPILLVGSNVVTLTLGILSLVMYVCVYTPMKRMSATSVIVGAIPGAMPALLGYTAVKGEVDAIGLSLFSIAFFWQLPHVIAIGIFRQEEYTSAGLWVIPEVVGVFWSKVWMVITTALLVVASLSLWWVHVGGPLYLVVAVGLGAWFLSICAYGFFVPTERLYAWARRVFFDSLIYQTVLFVALVIDVGGRHWL